MTDIGFKTIGTTFVEDISKAKNSDELFGILKKTCCVVSNQETVAERIKNLDLPNAAIEFKATLAKLQIKERNNKIEKHLAKMKNKTEVRNYLGKYLKQERDIPQVANYTYIAMDEYIKKGFGNADDFKRDLHKYMGEQSVERKEKIIEVQPQLLQKDLLAKKSVAFQQRA